MTEIKSNFWGRYTEDDLKKCKEENRILEMRWEVFEGLYDKTRQELEKAQKQLAEIPNLREEISKLGKLNDQYFTEIGSLKEIVNSTQKEDNFIDLDPIESEVSQKQL